MNYFEKLKNTLCYEVEQYADKKSLSASDLEMIHKLTDTIKNLDKIEMLEGDNGYSEHYPDYEDKGNSYARKGTHYVRAHYSRDDGDERFDKRYSRNDAKDHIMSKLGEMMEDADPNEREALKKAMREIERA